MKQNVYYALMRAGHAAGCHQKPARSLFYKGLQFPVCARCTGIMLGQFFGMALRCFYPLSWMWISFLCFLMFFDWFLQQMRIAQSTNVRRLITGALCGYALGQCYAYVLRKIYFIIFVRMA